LKASLSLVLERGSSGGKGSGEVGTRIGQIVGGSRLEKAPECGVIGSERQLEKCAASEHHEPKAVAR
jgi:hypothetical protein